VHAAALHDGTEVVVKVRRPGVVEQVEEDLAILHDLAAVAARRSRLSERYDLPGLVREFGQTLHAELDYLHEASNAERFAEQFADDAEVHIPRVRWETTTAGVLTLELMRGLRIDDPAALDAAGIDREALAERATRVILTMVFEHGFFHADPHPGNFFIEPGGRIGLIDFGMAGTLNESLREQLVMLLFAITSRDTVLVPFTRRLTRELYSPARLARRLAAAGIEATRLGLDLPKQVRHLLGELEQGRLTVSTHLQGIEPILDRVERLANRVVLGIIAAAFVNGLAVLMSVYDPLNGGRWLGAFFAVGFAIAAVLGAYLAWSILRPGRR
jgi:hypothetical protein